jgi:hypothetical protein
MVLFVALFSLRGNIPWFPCGLKWNYIHLAGEAVQNTFDLFGFYREAHVLKYFQYVLSLIILALACSLPFIYCVDQ